MDRTLALSRDNFTMIVGQKTLVLAAVFPDGVVRNGLTWECSDPTVQMVADGAQVLLTPSAVGTGRITAKYEDLECTTLFNTRTWEDPKSV